MIHGDVKYTNNGNADYTDDDDNCKNNDDEEDGIL